ncbi:Aste57867_8518 [Aphanomyces stellatus]|uniref:Golgi apparatus membrane protein TVP23 homolog n=1 Tax=Aphanomyces stellatus TaxID=120398 RepID=A0A485KG22_9STRA|nr:hypothetical protein As57867_008486 [Aphanomyces stellatus]KAF0706100.1 hypothetical protein As57867_006802 [Aphanomyces stellatus]KAF0706103.1 hypothetical protein As57867_006797 [Aphanomyces stellatus]VFT83781.1 Aste57867_6817 [Aphanomyces stellatus]VFT83786.1 Aste57867_6822 [Aphanomyces stellatus]
MSDKSKNLEFIDVPAEPQDSPVTSPRSRATTAVSSVEDSPRASAGLLSGVTESVRKAKHPVAAMFHLLFKVLALTVYILGGIMSDSFVFVFVICVLLLAFDFWTVKNVSGRLLVGLRWWNRINEDGSNEWVFESLEDMSEIDPLDAKIFWTGLYGAPVVWVLFLLIAVLKLNVEWALIAIVALTLSGANVVGYTKCSKDAKNKMQSMMTAGALEALNSSAGSTLISTISSIAFSSSTSRGKQPNNPSVVV